MYSVLYYTYCTVDCHTVSRYRRTAFPSLVFTKLTQRQQHYVQDSYTKFGPNRATNLEGTDWNRFVPHTKAWLSLYRFSWNSMLLDRVTWRSAIYRISAESVNKVWVLRVETLFLFLHIIQAWLTESIFTKLDAFSTTSVSNYTEFRENPTHFLVADIRSLTDKMKTANSPLDLICWWVKPKPRITDQGWPDRRVLCINLTVR